MISPAALKQWGNKDIAFHPVGTGPFKFVEWKATDYLKVEKFDGYWRKGYPKVDTITWKPVVDNNSRAALMQTGEAHFTFPVPYEVAEVLKQKPELDVVAAPSIVLRYLSMNTQQKPFDKPKVRQAIDYAINKEALAKVAFSGYAFPAEGVAPQGVEYAAKIGPWPYDVAKAKQLLTEAGYPNGFETELWSGVQPHDGAEGHAVHPAATPADRHQDEDHAARGRTARREGRELAGPGDRAGAPVLRRLVDVDRRSRLGAASAAVRRIVAAEAVQQGVLQECEGRRRHQECAAHDRFGGEGETLQGRAGDRSGTTRRGRRWSSSVSCRRTTRSCRAST